MIKCSIYDFYNIIFISVMFTCPKMQSGYYAVNKIYDDRSENRFTMCRFWVIYLQL